MNMKIYKSEDLRGGLTIESQSENYLLIRHYIGVVMLDDMEYLLSIGLECCGVTPSQNLSAMICCRKTI
jgi:hypothetical protein